MIRLLFEYSITFAPLLVLCDYYIESTLLYFVILSLGVLIMGFIQLIPFVNILYIGLWIWGFIIALNNYKIIWIILYSICMIINLLFIFSIYNSFIFSKEKKEQLSKAESNKQPKENVEKKDPCIKADPIDFYDNEWDPNLTFEENLRIIDEKRKEDDERLRGYQERIEKALEDVHKELDNLYETNINKKMTPEQKFIRQSVIDSLEKDITKRSFVGKIDILYFTTDEDEKILDLIPLEYIINNPYDDGFIELYLEFIPLSQRAKIGAAVSEIKSTHT